MNRDLLGFLRCMAGMVAVMIAWALLFPWVSTWDMKYFAWAREIARSWP